MLILWKARQKDPGLGYATTFLRQLEEVLGTCLERGVKVVANAGGLNPAGLAAKITELSGRLGLNARVAYITGDDLTPVLGDLQAAGHELVNLDTGLPLAKADLPVVTANAYLGGWGITAALEAGADVVVCPRVTDASLVTGPAAWWHGWRRDDWDALAGAVAAGHVIECGPQATGGNYSFLDEITDRRYPGFPIAEVAADGSSVITKHDGTGGARLGRHRHRPAALRDRRARLPQPRRRRALRHHPAGAGRPGPGRADRHPGQPAAGHPQGRAQHARRLPQHHDDGADRPGHRAEGRARRRPADRGCSAAPSSSASSTSACCASTTRTRRPTSRPPRTCGSPSRIRTSARSAARSPTPRWNSRWAVTPVSTPPRRPPRRARSASTGPRWSRPPSSLSGALCPTDEPRSFGIIRRRTLRPRPAPGRRRGRRAGQPIAARPGHPARPAVRRAVRRQGRQRQRGPVGLSPRAYAWLRDYLTVDGSASSSPRRPTCTIDRYELPNLLALNFVIHGLLGARRVRHHPPRRPGQGPRRVPALPPRPRPRRPALEVAVHGGLDRAPQHRARPPAQASGPRLAARLFRFPVTASRHGRRTAQGRRTGWPGARRWRPQPLDPDDEDPDEDAAPWDVDLDAIIAECREVTAEEVALAARAAARGLPGGTPVADGRRGPGQPGSAERRAGEFGAGRPGSAPGCCWMSCPDAGRWPGSRPRRPGTTTGTRARAMTRLPGRSAPGTGSRPTPPPQARRGGRVHPPPSAPGQPSRRPGADA